MFRPVTGVPTGWRRAMAEPQGRGGQHSGHTAERIFTSVHRAPRCYRWPPALL